MRSKTSLFKPVIIKTNLKRFWPVSLIYMIVLIFLLPVPLADIFRHSDDGLGIMHSVISILSTSQLIIFPVFAAAGGAFTCFFYLFSARSSNMIHAFPVDRKQLFASNFISGLILIAAPQVIAAIISAPFIMEAGLARCILPWLLTSLACLFIFYVIAVLSCVLAGHALAALVFYAFFNLAEGLMILLCRAFLSLTGFGLSGILAVGNMRQYILSPAMFITGVFGLSADYNQETMQEFARSVHYHGIIPLVIYVIVCCFITLLALYLYKKRRLETVQEMSAFAFMRPLMRWIIAFGVGTAAALAIESMGILSFPRFLVLLIIFALLSFFAVEMVLKKSFRIFRKRTVIEAALCVVCVSALFIILRNDTFGITNRIPDPDELSAAGLTSNVLIVKEDKEDIEKIEDVHKLILEHKAELIEYNSGAFHDGIPLEYLAFTYCRKDGSILSRGYYIPVDMIEIIEPLNELENDASLVSDYIFGINSDDIKWDSGNILEQSLDAETAEAIYIAYREDLEDGNIRWQTGSLEPDYWDRSCYVTLTGMVSPRLDLPQDKIPGMRAYYAGPYFSPATTWSMYGTPAREQVMAQFYVTTNCTHTIEVLKEAGIIETAEDLLPRMDEDAIIVG